MIDLRCQVLEDAEGRPLSAEASLQLCRAAYRGGVRRMVVTARLPATGDDTHASFLARYEQRLEELQQAGGEMPLLSRGLLLSYSRELPALVAEFGDRLTLGGGRRLFVSLPALRTPPETESVWEALAQGNFGVVLARPECSPALRRDPERIARWLSIGVTLQLDAASVCGAYGREVQRFAWETLRRYASTGQLVLASNASPGEPRRASLTEAAGEVARRLGQQRAHLLVEEVPARLIETGERADASSSKTSLRRSLTALLRPLRAN